MYVCIYIYIYIFGIEDMRLRPKESVTLTKCHPLSSKVGIYFADKRRFLGRYISLADSGHDFSFIYIYIYIYIYQNYETKSERQET
jgi:hypothetical protein